MSGTVSSPAGERGTLALWFGVLAGPLAWTVHLLLSYALLPVACSTGIGWVLHAVTLLTAGVTAWAGLVAYRRWQRHRDDPRDGVRGPRSGWRRFMALSGVALSALFFVVILLEGLPVAIVSPCLI